MKHDARENPVSADGDLPDGWSRPWHDLQRSLAERAPVQGTRYVRRSKLPRLARFPGGAAVCWLARARAPIHVKRLPHF
jgi:hypothetical protein